MRERDELTISKVTAEGNNSETARPSKARRIKHHSAFVFGDFYHFSFRTQKNYKSSGYFYLKYRLMLTISLN